MNTIHTRMNSPLVADYVLPLMIGVFDVNGQHTLRAESVEGTGFLIAGGDGLGITARHVALALTTRAPIPDPWGPVPATEWRAPLVAIFSDDQTSLRSAPILAVEPHPTEDVALFRLAPGDYASPYEITAAHHTASAEYSLWGYPDEVRHDLFVEGRKDLNVPLVYSAGHVRRRITAEIPINAVPGRNFYELSNPAGSCCSGAPVSLRRDPWRVIGVYVGERRNEAGTFSVGYATRAEVIAERWPQLVDGSGDLSELCPIPPNTGD